MEWKETAIIFTTLIHRFFFSYLQNQINDREIDDFYLQITIFWIWKLMSRKFEKLFFEYRKFAYFPKISGVQTSKARFFENEI